MTTTERGAVRNRGHYTQLKDYSRLRYGLITPSDIDGVIDFQNKAFVFLELKFSGAKMSFGQRLMYERICDACETGGVPSIVIVADHKSGRDEMIAVHDLPVIQIRFQRKWFRPQVSDTVKGVVDRFQAKYAGQHNRGGVLG